MICTVGCEQMRTVHALLAKILARVTRKLLGKLVGCDARVQPRAVSGNLERRCGMWAFVRVRCVPSETSSAWSLRSRCDSELGSTANREVAS